MTGPRSARARPDMQKRPSEAERHRVRSVRTRLMLWVGASVLVVVGLAIAAWITIAGERLERHVRETARLTALALADDLELRPVERPDDIEAVLEEFVAAASVLRSVSYFHVSGSAFEPVATTFTEAPPFALMRQALRAGEPVWDETDGQIAAMAAPVTRDDEPVGVVVVTVSVDALGRLRREGELLGAGAMLVAAFVIAALTHLFTRKLVLAPLEDVSDAVATVTGGNLAARARVRRDDEIGELASRLNGMLDELEDLHHSLHERVTEATGALRLRNEELSRSYEQMLQLRQAVGRAEQLAAVGQTMADVAHQIGTPLNLVSGHVQLLAQEVDDPALLRRVRIVEEQVERVTASVRTLLDRARPAVVRQPIALAALVSRLADALRPRLTPSAIELAADIPQAATVLGEETPLELALLNVMTNAIDAMPDGGVLSVRARACGGLWAIDIEDTGPGIPPDLLPRVFDPWVSTKGVQGSGLGLSVTREVVERGGGTVTAANRPGRGARVTITLMGDDVDATGGHAVSDPAEEGRAAT